MDGWREWVPMLLLLASAALVAGLLLVFRPDDLSTRILALSLVSILLAAPAAVALRARSALRRASSGGRSRPAS